MAKEQDTSERCERCGTRNGTHEHFCDQPYIDGLLRRLAEAERQLEAIATVPPAAKPNDGCAGCGLPLCLLCGGCRQCYGCECQQLAKPENACPACDGTGVRRGPEPEDAARLYREEPVEAKTERVIAEGWIHTDTDTREGFPVYVKHFDETMIRVKIVAADAAEVKHGS